MNQPPYSEMVVVITGASSGIGRSAAVAFAEKGTSVVLAARDTDALDEVVRECEAAGASALAVPTDVGDRKAVEALAEAAIERFGQIDTWVNNAAVMAYGTFEDIPPDVFDKILQTNLNGTVYGSRVALAHFSSRGQGVLINVDSLWGRIPSPLVSPYVASKFAVRALSECIHAELADEDDIQIATILPSATDTPIFDNAANFIGKGLRPVWPISSAASVADGIVESARTPKREVTHGKLGRLLEVLYDLAPPLYRRVSPGMFMGGTITDEHVEESNGSVFEPAAGHPASGGWVKDQPKELAKAFAGAARGGLLGLLGQAEKLKP